MGFKIDVCGRPDGIPKSLMNRLMDERISLREDEFSTGVERSYSHDGFLLANLNQFPAVSLDMEPLRTVAEGSGELVMDFQNRSILVHTPKIIRVYGMGFDERTQQVLSAIFRESRDEMFVLYRIGMPEGLFQPAKIISKDNAVSFSAVDGGSVDRTVILDAMKIDIEDLCYIRGRKKEHIAPELRERTNGNGLTMGYAEDYVFNRMRVLKDERDEVVARFFQAFYRIISLPVVNNDEGGGLVEGYRHKEVRILLNCRDGSVGNHIRKSGARIVGKDRDGCNLYEKTSVDKYIEFKNKSPDKKFPQEPTRRTYNFNETRHMLHLRDRDVLNFARENGIDFFLGGRFDADKVDAVSKRIRGTEPLPATTIPDIVLPDTVKIHQGPNPVQQAMPIDPPKTVEKEKMPAPKQPPIVSVQTDRAGDAIDKKPESEADDRKIPGQPTDSIAKTLIQEKEGESDPDSEDGKEAVPDPSDGNVSKKEQHSPTSNHARVKTYPENNSSDAKKFRLRRGYSWSDIMGEIGCTKSMVAFHIRNAGAEVVGFDGNGDRLYNADKIDRYADQLLCENKLPKGGLAGVKPGTKLYTRSEVEDRLSFMGGDLDDHIKVSGAEEPNGLFDSRAIDTYANGKRLELGLNVEGLSASLGMQMEEIRRTQVRLGDYLDLSMMAQIMGNTPENVYAALMKCQVRMEGKETGYRVKRDVFAKFLLDEVWPLNEGYAMKILMHEMHYTEMDLKRISAADQV